MHTYNWKCDRTETYVHCTAVVWYTYSGKLLLLPHYLYLYLSHNRGFLIVWFKLVCADHKWWSACTMYLYSYSCAGQLWWALTAFRVISCSVLLLRSTWVEVVVSLVSARIFEIRKTSADGTYSDLDMSGTGENGEIDQNTRLLDSTTKKLSASTDLGKHAKTGKIPASIKYKIIPQNLDVKSTYISQSILFPVVVLVFCVNSSNYMRNLSFVLVCIAVIHRNSRRILS